MKTKVCLMMMLALCVTLCLSQVVSAAPLITSVDRTNGVSGDRDHIGAFTGETDPIQDQPGTLPDSWLLRDGHYVFSDRDYPWTTTPPEMIDVEYVTTFNSDKGDDGDVNYAVTVSGGARFWVTMDDRFSGPQARVDDIVSDFASAGTFTDSGYNVYVYETSTNPARPLSVYISSVISPAGTYNFGYPADSNANNYYVIGAFEEIGRPIADAGPDQSISWPDTQATLAAEIQDDGDPNNVLVYWWEVTGQPAGSSINLSGGLGPFTITVEPGGDVDPDTPYAVTPTVTVNQTGVYTLRLNARDTDSEANDTVRVIVYPVEPGLVAYYDFNEGAGKVVHDTAIGIYEPNDTTMGFDGPYIHDLATSSTQSGVIPDPIGDPGVTRDPNWGNGPTGAPFVGSHDFGTAMYFDPDFNQAAFNDVIANVNTDEEYLNGFAGCTIMMWIKSGMINTDRGFIIFEDPAGNDTHGFRYDTAGGDTGGDDVLKGGFTSTGGGNELETSANMQTTEWQHVAMTWKSGEEFKWYINGIQDTGQDSKSPIGGVLDNYQKIIVGRGGKDHLGDIGPDFGWRGLIDEVKIFQKALSAAEVQEEAHITNGPPTAHAGPDQQVVETTSNQLVLSGASIDDIPGNADAKWTFTGPGVPTFDDDTLVNPTVTFPAGGPYGLYQLTLTATDQAVPAWTSNDSLYVMYQAKASYGQVVLYEMEDAGTTVSDTSGNLLHGTFLLDPNWVAGKVGSGALHFYNDSPELGEGVDASVVPGSDDFTAMFWMKADALRNAVPIDKLPNDGSGAGWNIKLRANGEVWLRVGSEGDYADVPSSAGAYAVDTWVHVAATFNDTTNTGKIFISGLKEGENTGITQTAFNVYPPLQLAQPSEAQLGERYQGALDQVRYYDYEMTELQVALQAVADMVEMEGCNLDIPGTMITGDISGPAGVPDCYVDLFDVAALAGDWLECRDLNNPSCWP